MQKKLFAQHALLPTGWANNVRISWNAQGIIEQVICDAQAVAGEESVTHLMAGMPNLHSHAFQRAFAGLTEYRSSQQDSFWSWRKLMYAFASQISPEQLEAVATWLYAEMLEAGYTSVCEFHYVHHQPDGQPYADAATLSQSLLNAAKNTGIGLTLLPVCYQASGFGGLPPNEGQKRFINTTQDMLKLLEQLQPLCQAQHAKLGVAPHSLRAVIPASLQELVTGLRRIDRSAPIHIHIAEQIKEVEDCVAWSGQRPVAWLLDHMDVNANWCLVHATHMDAHEYKHAATRGAVVGICPTTEANLGDGVFDFPQWYGHQGNWGIGSDSHATVNAAEELLLLEYSQRLYLRQRNVGANQSHQEVATSLYLQAVKGGAQASGRPIAGIAVGQCADFVELDIDNVAIAGLPVDKVLSGHVFGSSRTTAIRRVWTQGQIRVNKTHALHETARRAFIDVRMQLLDAI
jgi:formimidoylglutamate deiminase